MDDSIATFITFTGASLEQAENYLRIAEGNISQAVQLFFEVPMDIPASSNAPSGSAPDQPPRGTHGDAISVDDDAVIVDDNDDDDDDDLRTALRDSQHSGPASAGGNSPPITAESTRTGHLDDDEAMARRLQEEFYSDLGAQETNGVRAPIARTTETLVGPDEVYMEQISPRMRPGRRPGAGPPGIFNQRSAAPNSVWGEGGAAARRELADATGGASERSSKHHTLAEMYRPPYEIIEHLSLDDARDSAKDLKKWILVNIQDTSIFDCQVLNRDIWKSKEVKDTIKENFLFLQYDRSGNDGQTYVRRYFPHAIDVPPTSSLNPFPIIAIVDPRTGEQVKVWTETPKKPLEFVMQLHEFLDRYSLDKTAKNPVQIPGQSVRKIDVDHMTEDEMLDLAVRNSLNNGAESASAHHDPDQLTREQEKGKGKQPKEEDNLMDFDDDELQTSAPAEQTPFQRISKTNHHVEPPMSAPGSTRIQFRLADGSRVVRRFLLGEKVTRLYEWIKADLLPEQAAKKGEEVTAATSDRQFELVSMGKNLIDRLDSTLEEAQLKLGTVMIEFVDNE